MIVVCSFIVGCERTSVDTSLELNNNIESTELNENTELTELNRNTESVELNDKKDLSESSSVVISFKHGADHFSSGAVMGGILNEQWIVIEDLKLNGSFNEEINNTNGLVKDNDLFHFYSSYKKVAVQKITKTTLRVSQSSGETILSAYFDPIQVDDKFLIGISGEWEAQPRILEVSDDEKSYRVDIEGDGMLDDIIVEDIEIEQTDYYSDGIRVSLKKDNQLILITEMIVDGEYISDYDIVAIDLNGDNKLEIIISAVGHNYYIAAYEFKESKFNRVLDFYDGD